MKIIAEKTNLKPVGNDLELTFTVSGYNHKRAVQSLENKDYSIEIKEIKSKRTIEQNKYLWLLIHEIDEAINGKSLDEMGTYVMLLEMANAKYDFVAIVPEAEDMLRKNFRAIQFVKKIDLNGKEGHMYKVFLGSSQMNVKEMHELINVALDLASQLGLDTDYYREVLI